jgi:hypothetical protein
MNPGNGASSSILPGSEEGIGGRHGFPDTLAVTAVYNEWTETLLTSMLDDTALRLAEGHPTADPKAELEDSMLPAGGAKGATLALMAELLVTALTAA